MEEAIRREKLLKKWRRDWKFRIIEEMNPNWIDLHDIIDANVTFDLVSAGPRPSPG
jgi:putative endonuclease